MESELGWDWMRTRWHHDFDVTSYVGIFLLKQGDDSDLRHLQFDFIDRT